MLFWFSVQLSQEMNCNQYDEKSYKYRLCYTIFSTTICHSHSLKTRNLFLSIKTDRSYPSTSSNLVNASSYSTGPYFKTHTVLTSSFKHSSLRTHSFPSFSSESKSSLLVSLFDFDDRASYKQELFNYALWAIPLFAWKHKNPVLWTNVSHISVVPLL